jgi:hypothetical protein
MLIEKYGLEDMEYIKELFNEKYSFNEKSSKFLVKRYKIL